MKKNTIRNILIAVSLIMLITIASVLIACKPKDDQKLKNKVLVTTGFLKDIVNEVVGKDSGLEIVQLIPNDEDPHSYKLSSEKEKLIANVSHNGGVIFYHGLGFEHNLLKILEANKAVNVSKNFKEPKDKNNSVNGEIRYGYFDEDDENSLVQDPHFWFDVILYKQAVDVVKDTFKNRMKDKANVIEENANKYKKQLDELDVYSETKLKELANKLPNKKIYLVTPHDAFGYFARRHSAYFEVIAPQGVSADEATTQAIDKTVDKILENNIHVIFAETTTSPEKMGSLREKVEQKRPGYKIVVPGLDKDIKDDHILADALEDDGNATTYIGFVKHNIDMMVKHIGANIE